MLQTPVIGRHLPDAVLATRTLALAAAGTGVGASALWLLLGLPVGQAQLVPHLAAALVVPTLAAAVARRHARARVPLAILAVVAAGWAMVSAIDPVSRLTAQGEGLRIDLVMGLTTSAVLSLVGAGLYVALARCAVSPAVSAWCLPHAAAATPAEAPLAARPQVVEPYFPAPEVDPDAP